MCIHHQRGGGGRAEISDGFRERGGAGGGGGGTKNDETATYHVHGCICERVRNSPFEENSYQRIFSVSRFRWFSVCLNNAVSRRPQLPFHDHNRYQAKKSLRQTRQSVHVRRRGRKQNGRLARRGGHARPQLSTEIDSAAALVPEPSVEEKTRQGRVRRRYILGRRSSYTCMDRPTHVTCSSVVGVGWRVNKRNMKTVN